MNIWHLGIKPSFSVLIQTETAGNSHQFDRSQHILFWFLFCILPYPQTCRQRVGFGRLKFQSHWGEKEQKRRWRLWRFTCWCCWSVSPVHEDSFCLCILAADLAWIPFVASLNAVFATQEQLFHFCNITVLATKPAYLMRQWTLMHCEVQ